MFTSPLASALTGFLEFRRRRGYRYNRAEFTLRSFDKLLTERARHDAAWQLDEVILAWLGSRPARLAVSVSQDMAVVRQFWFYLRRHDPARCRREVRWPKLPRTCWLARTRRDPLELSRNQEETNAPRRSYDKYSRELQSTFIELV